MGERTITECTLPKFVVFDLKDNIITHWWEKFQLENWANNEIVRLGKANFDLRFIILDTSNGNKLYLRRANKYKLM